MVRCLLPASAQPIQSSTPRFASRFAVSERSPNRAAARWAHSVLVSVTASVLRFWSMSEPPHAGHLAAGSADPRQTVGDRLDRHRHVEGIGVDHAVATTRDGHMTFPEDDVAVLQAGEGDRLAERLLLHVAVARTGDAAGRERHLHQAGAIDAEARLAAP